MSQPLNIFFPNGQVEAVQMYVWDGVKPALWTGAITNGGIVTGSYDYVSVVYASTTDTYTFKTGGSGGTLVATVVITYTDSTKALVSIVVKT